MTFLDSLIPHANGLFFLLIVMGAIAVWFVKFTDWLED